jgi:hypothetical protein
MPAENRHSHQSSPSCSAAGVSGAAPAPRLLRFLSDRVPGAESRSSVPGGGRDNKIRALLTRCWHQWVAQTTVPTNVLCRLQGRGYRCVGFLDLEAAWAGPPEADVAVAELIHGPLFAPLPAGWTEEFRRGYRTSLDAASLAFYRGLHLSNLGYHAALTGLDAHAADVLTAVRVTAATLRRLLRSSVRSPAAAIVHPT